MELLIGMLVLLPMPGVVHSALHLRRRRQRLAQWAGSEVAISERALRGYKLAQVVIDDPGNAYLMSVLSVRYGVDDHAECLRRRCSPPGLDCRCGFYAFTHRAAAVDLLHELSRTSPNETYALLSVDLDGDVLEYERGYRAQRQRVVRVELPHRCSGCHTHEQGASPVDYVAHPRFRAEHLGSTRDLQAHRALPEGAAPLRALCQHHAPAHEMSRLSLSDVRARLNTEVAVLSMEDQPPREKSPEAA